MEANQGEDEYTFDPEEIAKRLVSPWEELGITEEEYKKLLDERENKDEED